MNVKEAGLLLLWIKLLSEWIKVRLSLGTDYSLPAHHGIFFFLLQKLRHWTREGTHLISSISTFCWNKTGLKCSKRKVNSATSVLAAHSVCCYTIQCIAWGFILFCLIFEPFFSLFHELTEHQIPPAVKSENTISTTKAKQTQNRPTLTPFFWVFCLICSILCECWRKGIVASKLEWIKSEIEINIFSFVMVIFYMLRTLVCCPLALMHKNLKRKSDKNHFDSAMKSLL